MFGAVAAGPRRGGYDYDRGRRRGHGPLQGRRIGRIPAHRAVYDVLYPEYVRLHDYFGRGENDVMKRLRGLREKAIVDGRARRQPGGSTDLIAAAPAATLRP